MNAGKHAAEQLVKHGSLAVEPLRGFLLEGIPRKIFQPRIWTVEALARLGAKDVLLEYLLQIREIPDPEDRFGEEAVESTAARLLAAWPCEDVYQSLLKLSERRMLIGLIETLAEYKRLETISYFERALEDDFYRPAAEGAFEKLGPIACSALAISAVTPTPNLPSETPSSLQRRRSAVKLLHKIGIPAEYWQILRKLIYEPDQELMVAGSKFGIRLASREERVIIAHRLIGLISSGPWYLRGDINDSLIALKHEAQEEIEDEIALRMSQPEEVRTTDDRLRALLCIKRRFVGPA
ncbi:MAG: hypothetical protein ACLQDI_24545 [Syntrophobacteraceae bacterium]